MKAVKLYIKSCEEIIKAFSKKQSIEFSGWVDNEFGNKAIFGDHIFKMSDIIFDITSNQQTGLIMEWYDYSKNIN